MGEDFYAKLSRELEELKLVGNYRMESTYSAVELVGNIAVNLGSNDYLGLARQAQVVAAAAGGLAQYGLGLASSRLIGGTTVLHQKLEQQLSRFLGMEESVVYSSSFEAIGSLFESILEAEDAIISDAGNPTSINDGVRLCKAQRFRYLHNDLVDLELKLREAVSEKSRYKLIVTAGVFPTDGTIAHLPEIVALADKYGAFVAVDDSHAVGSLGYTGRGSLEHYHLAAGVDILMGALDHALGSGVGGYISGKKALIAWLKQRAWPYLFANALVPMAATAAMQSLTLLEQDSGLVAKLQANAAYLRQGLEHLGFKLVSGEHAIISILIGEIRLAQVMVERLIAAGIYVTSFAHQLVPGGKAHVRAQVSAVHEFSQLEAALQVFAQVGKTLGIIG